MNYLSSPSEDLEAPAKVAAIDGYLDELETEFGTPSAQEIQAAKVWADRIFGK